MHVLHEHPLGATSWGLDCIKDLTARANTHTVDSHMCAFGLTSTDPQGTGLVKKPTRFATSSPLNVEALSRQCSNRGKSGDEQYRHVHLMSGSAARAAEYSEELCRAICRGLISQKQADDSNVCLAGVLSGFPGQGVHFPSPGTVGALHFSSPGAVGASHFSSPGAVGASHFSQAHGLPGQVLHTPNRIHEDTGTDVGISTCLKQTVSRNTFPVLAVAQIIFNRLMIAVGNTWMSLL